MGWTDLHIGETKQAAAVFEEALELKTRLKGPEDTETLCVGFAFAWAYYSCAGEFYDASVLFNQMQKWILGPGHPLTLFSKHGLPRTLSLEQKLNPGIVGVEQLLAEQTKVLGKEQDTPIETLSLQAWVFRSRTPYN